VTRRCPNCGGELERVRQGGSSYLNADQFDAVKCGDWWCERCPPEVGNRNRGGLGGAYFFDDDLDDRERAAGWEDRWNPYPEAR
jgi:hypothetical protein